MIDDYEDEAYDSAPQEEELMTLAQAATFLGVTRQTLVRWRKKGILVAYVTPLGYVRLKKSDVLKAKEEVNSLQRI